MPVPAASPFFFGTTDIGYDGIDNVLSLTYKDSGGTTVDSFTYVYDHADRVTSETRGVTSATQDFNYDDTNQLTDDGTNTYSWDANGNPTGADVSIGTDNQLDSDADWTYSYDAVGNLIEKDSTGGGGIWKYEYNNANQMVKATHQATAVGAVDLEVDYKYDVLGNKQSRTVDPDGAGATSPTTEKYTYDSSGNAWADLSSGGSLTTRRIFGDGIDELVARITSGTIAWYETDRQGTVRGMLNNSATLSSQLEYDGFGKLVSGTATDRYQYTGREWDVELGLQYNRARFYDPETRRWMSQDPLGFDAGDSNLYRYLSNKPTVATDPSGLQLMSVSPLSMPTTKEVESRVEWLREFFVNTPKRYFNWWAYGDDPTPTTGKQVIAEQVIIALISKGATKVANMPGPSLGQGGGFGGPRLGSGPALELVTEFPAVKTRAIRIPGPLGLPVFNMAGDGNLGGLGGNGNAPEQPREGPTSADTIAEEMGPGHIRDHGDPNTWRYLGRRTVPATEAGRPAGSRKVYEVFLDENGRQIEWHYWINLVRLRAANLCFQERRAVRASPDRSS